MRVTQSMLSSNMLRNLSNSYSKMGKLQDQINTGSKISRPSDDPVIAVKGIGYRTNLNKVEQYKRNMGEVENWLDTSDDTLDHVGIALRRVQELVTNAASDTNTDEDREKMKKEIDQIKLQIRDLANTKVGEKYLFSGTNTLSPVFENGKFAGQTFTEGDSLTNLVNTANPGFSNSVEIEVYDGVNLDVNTKAVDMFAQIDDMLTSIQKDLADPAGTIGSKIGDHLSTISTVQNKVLENRADIGARQNRVDMMINRLATQEVVVTKQLSDNEDIDYERVITDMITQESIHQAALSVGAKIIQSTLVDFIR
ncbi:flagellar hook-associated protein FlgL [Psychrobacillus sp. Sa2BUA9]|uniref:Flagellar hook-associated protein FlgL n=1 Tax=Psychrobacillus faecigallinarum TaxID=2762235 RepID=A0ABR8R5H8_9BACI|nr:flagellar hook-associated protein FlgL [Psychrobacillus faecigallinarum]MBD7943044.1 flagellar hook-associated protein FlgL [Psychrobacillus faecigallinarum]